MPNIGISHWIFVNIEYFNLRSLKVSNGFLRICLSPRPPIWLLIVHLFLGFRTDRLLSTLLLSNHLRILLKLPVGFSSYFNRPYKFASVILSHALLLTGTGFYRSLGLFLIFYSYFYIISSPGNTFCVLPLDFARRPHTSYTVLRQVALGRPNGRPSWQSGFHCMA